MKKYKFLFDIWYKVVAHKTNCVSILPRELLKNTGCCGPTPDGLNQNVSPVMGIWEPTVFGTWDKGYTIQLVAI